VVVSPSLFLQEFYRLRGFFAKSKMAVLRNPIQLVQSAQNSMRTIHTDGTIHFFAAGTLNRGKGLLFLCTAFHQWRASSARLWIAGSGPDEDAIRKLCVVDSRIHFLGRLTHDEVLKELQRMHYAVIPSLCYENAPTFVTESFSVGVPVLVAKVGGAAEGVEDGVNGFVCAPGDMQSFVQGLNRSLEYVDYPLLSRRAISSLQGRSTADYVKRLISL